MIILPTLPNAVKLAAMHALALRHPEWSAKMCLSVAVRSLRSSQSHDVAPIRAAAT